MLRFCRSCQNNKSKSFSPQQIEPCQRRRDAVPSPKHPTPREGWEHRGSCRCPAALSGSSPVSRGSIVGAIATFMQSLFFIKRRFILAAGMSESTDAVPCDAGHQTRRRQQAQ